MSVEDFSIHPQNQVLAGLRDTRGDLCGEEVIRRALNSDLFILLGEPAVGKSTITDQIAHEMRLRGIPYEIVAYDDVLEEDIKDRGMHEEDARFNKRLVQKVLEARTRMSPRGGVVIFDTCAVGNKTPKDRSVTAVEELVKLTNEGNNLFHSNSVLALIGSIYNQYQTGRRRSDILGTPPHLLITNLRDRHNIVIEGIPPDFSEEEVAERIQAVTRRTAQFHHIVSISSEVLLENVIALQEQSYTDIYDIHIPRSFRGRDRLLARLKASGMHRRARELGLAENQWLTAINPQINGPVTWHAQQFLRMDTD